LASSGAVLIEGAKWCGKTRSAEQIAKSVLYLQDPDVSQRYLQTADVKPSLLLIGENPRLIDEWQMAPVLWDAVRFAVDRRGETGLFLLTGSAVPSDNVTAHTGTGRIARLTMRPMSLSESGESNKSVSLAALFRGETDIAAVSNLSIEQIAFLIARGGWPAAVNMTEDTSLSVATNYLTAVINQDISRVDGIEKNPERASRLLRSLARNTATMVSAQTIIRDVESQDVGMSEKTFMSYMNALKRIFVVEDQLAWQPSLRSKTAIRTSSKRHFVDPSLAVAALRTGPDGLLADFETFGFLFESLCTRDMRVYAQVNDGNVYHYRDKNNLESDMIIQLNNGQWAPVEVKMGSRQIDEAAHHLKKLCKYVDIQKMGAPAFMMVLTAGEFAYKRDDGILVVPIGCLTA
jgi:predicted AAA+ superfamily ATPase